MLFRGLGRYRIIQHPSHFDPTKPVYEVQERAGLWWEHAGLCQTLDDAEELVRERKAASQRRVHRKVVRLFD